MGARILIVTLAALIALGGLAAGVSAIVDDDEDPDSVSSIELRKDDAAEDEAVADDADDDPDPQPARVGDGDDTRGDDGSAGGDNTGDGDSTRGNDGSGGGDNSAVAAAPAPAGDDSADGASAGGGSTG